MFETPFQTVDCFQGQLQCDDGQDGRIRTGAHRSDKDVRIGLHEVTQVFVLVIEE